MISEDKNDEEILKKLDQYNFLQIVTYLRQGRLDPSEEIDYLKGQGFLTLFEMIKSMKVNNDEEEGDRYEVLDVLMKKIEFYCSLCDFDINEFNLSEDGQIEFSASEIANIRLREDERGSFLKIINTSKYSYKEHYFGDHDTFGHRFWSENEELLYFFIFRGHVESIELLYDESNPELFYSNLERLKDFPCLECLNLLFFCEYYPQARRVEKILRSLNLYSPSVLTVYRFEDSVDAYKLDLFR